MVTVETKYVGEVKDCFREGVGYRWTLEDGNEDYIKKELAGDGRI